jgi:DNA polymerase-3 subunit delta'
MTALESLSGNLCPWLAPALQQFEAAREQGHLGHAWLIFGPAGTGKINLALVLARRLLGNRSALGELDPDTALTALGSRHGPVDRHPDLHWLYPEEDKETISVDQVREVSEALALTANRGVAKVVIVEPAEAMTTAAANALLKTLEEPSADTYLLLLSHRPGRLPATIRSRCQHRKLAPPTAEVVASWLRVPVAVVVEAERLVGSAPFEIAGVVRRGETLWFRELENILTAISEDKADPLAVAHAWAKERTETILAWLWHRLHDEIRSRAPGTGVSTGVTVPALATLHNALRGVPLRTLFDQHDRAEKLLNQLGSGINVELALQALLSGFQANRGRP